ncbi:meiosis-specific nuclear structural protein 1, isoform CRA_a [Mus musculus]|nr:meiosis-specific nuclear structural protein 1, isoform CRA_a [Mus musculus]
MQPHLFRFLRALQSHTPLAIQWLLFQGSAAVAAAPEDAFATEAETHPAGGGGLKPTEMATKKRALSFSEKHQKLVDEKFRKSLNIQVMNKLERQAKNQVVQNENDEKVERQRFLRVLQNEQFELDMEEAIQKAEANKMLRDRQLEQEERLANELARLKHESLKDKKMRQQVRENSIELRELEQKLKAAYMNKERAAQIVEKDAMKYEQMKRDAEIERIMMEEHDRLLKEESAKQERRNKERAQYYLDLEKQLEDQERRKQEAYEQLLKEKLMIDEIVRKIYEEDQVERQQKLEKKNAIQKYIEEFQRAQDFWRQKKREEMEEENRKIIEFANIQEQREGERMARVHEIEEKRVQRQNLLMKQLEETLRQRDDLEQVRQELYQEEQAEIIKLKVKEEAELRLRRQREMKQDFEDQMALKELILQAAKEEEETFKKAMLAKFAEDDRIELMNAQKQRMKQLEHKRAVEKLIEERRSQFLADKGDDRPLWAVCKTLF